MAASDENYVFDLIDSNAPFALMGAGSYITTASVIAPAVLFEELELEPVEEEIPKPPIVPPPPLTGQSAHQRASTALPTAGRDVEQSERQLDMGLLFRVHFSRSGQERDLRRGAVYLRALPAAGGKALRDPGAQLGAARHRGSSLRAGDSVHADVYGAAGRAGGRADRAEPDVGRRRDHRHARGRRSQPQSDPAGAAVRLAGHAGDRHRFAVADALRHLENVQGSQSTGGGRTYFGSAAAGFRRRLSQSRCLYQRRDSGRDGPLAQRIYRRHDAGGGAEEDRSRSRRRAHRHRSRATPSPSRMWRTIRSSFLSEGATYDVGKDPTDYYTYSAPMGEQILEATKPSDVHAKGYTEIDTLPLYRLAYHDKTLDHDNVIQARIELHQRLALPPACFLLALIGIPLGISSRKGGKSSAFVFTVALAFVYWMGLIAANGLAKQQKLPVGVAMWIPNAVFAVVGMFLLTRLERPGDRDWIGVITGWITARWARLRELPAAAAHVALAQPCLADVPGSSDRRWLRAVQFPVLLRAVAGQFRADDARLHVFRFAQRHREEPHCDVARFHLFILPDAAIDFRFGAHQRAGGGFDHFRNSHQAQRDHGFQGERHQPVPAGESRCWWQRY